MNAFFRDRTRLAVLAAVLLLVLAPQLVYATFLMKLMCFALLAAAFNLVGGYAGLLSFGHAMFFGGAAYAYAYLVKQGGWPFEAALLGAIAFAALLGVVTGLVAIRRHGIYFGMVTLALGQMFYFVCAQLPLTGGEDGLQGLARVSLFGLSAVGSDSGFYYVILLLFCAGFAALWRVVRSPFGETLGAIRDNEQRAISLGCDVNRYKLKAFVLSAAFAGLAGAMFAATMGFASLNGVSWHLSGEAIMMTLIGGMATLLGPLVGALVVVAIQTYLASLGAWILVIQGAAFVLAVLFFPRGVVGAVLQRLESRRGPGRTRT